MEGSAEIAEKRHSAAGTLLKGKLFAIPAETLKSLFSARWINCDAYKQDA